MSLPKDSLNRNGDACQIYPETLYYARRVSDCGHQPVFKKILPDGRFAELSPKASQKLWNHSPDGFQWGYGGSGPAQLALALLLDATSDPDLAGTFHQPFKWRFVAAWRSEWSITSREILDWVKAQQALELEKSFDTN